MNPNELGPPFDAQVSVKMPKSLLADLKRIEAKHGISPSGLLRRLGAEAAGFYARNRWFSFPLRIVPEQFQNQLSPDDRAKLLNPEYIAVHSDELDTSGGKTPKMKTDFAPELKQKRGKYRLGRGKRSAWLLRFPTGEILE